MRMSLQNRIISSGIKRVTFQNPLKRKPGTFGNSKCF